ncbi:MAG: hypothetical protein ACI81V_001194, partial [Lentimonas sp.]
QLPLATNNPRTRPRIIGFTADATSLRKNVASVVTPMISQQDDPPLIPQGSYR